MLRAVAKSFRRPLAHRQPLSALPALLTGGWRTAPNVCASAVPHGSAVGRFEMSSSATVPSMQPAPIVDRALATVRRISAIKPMPGADRVCLAIVDGWQAVVAVQDGFKAGQRVVYFEIDSFLPPAPHFEFLRRTSVAKHPVLGEGFRLKTMRMRGALSQGLVLPLSALPLPPGADAEGAYPDGADVTAALGVRKWEPPPAATGTALPPGVGTGWPAFLSKTDQPRVQNIAASIWGDGHSSARGSDDAAALRDEELFEVTLKLDGTSCTVFHRNGALGVCSRNLQVWSGGDAADTAGVYSRVGAPVAARLASLGRNLALQGEIMGPGVQGNRERLPAAQLFAFDVWDIDAQAYLPAPERRALCAALGLSHAPVLHEAVPLRTAFPSLEALLAYADGLPSLPGGHAIGEGLVAKSVARPGFSFKAISNRFLLKCEA